MKNKKNTPSEIVHATLQSGSSWSAKSMENVRTAFGSVMSRCRLLTLAVLLAGAGNAHAWVDVWFSSTMPYTVASGQQYYVGATMTSTAWGDFGCWLTIYKNNVEILYAYAQSGGTDTSAWVTDYGAQTVEYRAEAYDWEGENKIIYTSVEIT